MYNVAKSSPLPAQQIFKNHNSYKHRSNGPKKRNLICICWYKFIKKIQVIILQGNTEKFGKLILAKGNNQVKVRGSSNK